MKHILIKLIILLSILNLIGCTSKPFHLVYRIDIPQGNIVNDEIEQLKPGMSKEQVTFILGNPMLVDVFHKNRWDYYYALSRRSKTIKKQDLVLYFNEKDRLDRWTFHTL